MKKIAVLGKGTAGSLVAARYAKFPFVEVDWYFDPNVPSQTVGEGSALELPRFLYQDLNFTHIDLARVDGSSKYGIRKEGWGTANKQFDHNFSPPSVGYHFNAVKLQDYIRNNVDKSKVNIIPLGVDADSVDADYVIDCSGKPSNYDDFIQSEFIPVNSVYVNQCFWAYPKFQFTGTVARPHGWVFLIPLQNRCSVGYLYNKDISTIEEVKQDIQVVIDRWGLTASKTTNSLSFGNYYRAENFTGNVARNGNASFFLEPLEATSISMMYHIQSITERRVRKIITDQQANREYLQMIEGIEHIIMMHYFAGSPFKTAFWDFAQERGERCMQRAVKDPEFVHIVKTASHYKSMLEFPHNSTRTFLPYAVWSGNSFVENLNGLGIKEKLVGMMTE